MTTIETMNTDADLSKFLLKTILEVRQNEISIERGIAISLLADKYVKNEMVRLMKTRMESRTDKLALPNEPKTITIKVD